MSNRGFTLIEVLVVLSVLSMLLVIFPFLHSNKRIQLRFETQILYEKLLLTQGGAIAQKKLKTVDFHGNYYEIDKETFTLPTAMKCNSTPFHYTPVGSVSQALTIHCRIDTNTKDIVIQLGSGRMYVK